MKFLSYSLGGVRSFGVLMSDEFFVDIPFSARRLKIGGAASAGQTLDDGLKNWDATLQLARQCIEVINRQPEHEVDMLVRRVSDVNVESPLSRPSKIIGIGLNYVSHCLEQKVTPPKFPILFSKFPNSIIGPGSAIRWNSRLTKEVDFEAELAVVIGARACVVPAEQAMEHVAGYTVLNDVSARDLQFGDRQWSRGKSLDTFCPMGPFLVTRDEVGAADGLGIRCRVNGIVYQDANTSEMIFPVTRVISFISQGITLEPGDVIATGTPAGVGVFRNPPCFLKHGDEVIVTIEGIGDLRNHVEVIDEELP